jgi:hypothetical protein
MILLDTQKSLQIKLDAAISTPLSVSVNYFDGIYNRSQLSFVSTVDYSGICSQPQFAKTFQVAEITVYNSYSGNVGISVCVKEGNDYFIKKRAILSSGDTLTYSQFGWEVTNEMGELKMSHSTNSGSESQELKELFVPTNGQTDFTLSQTPKSVAIVKPFVNDSISIEDFIVSGKTLSFINTQYQLSNQDLLTVIYK